MRNKKEGIGQIILYYKAIKCMISCVELTIRYKSGMKLLIFALSCSRLKQIPIATDWIHTQVQYQSHSSLNCIIVYTSIVYKWERELILQLNCYLSQNRGRQWPIILILLRWSTTGMAMIIARITMVWCSRCSQVRKCICLHIHIYIYGMRVDCIIMM